MTRQTPPAPAQDDETSLWRFLDVAVIVALVVVIIFAVEWIGGAVIRERLAREASAHLAQVHAGPPAQE